MASSSNTSGQAPTGDDAEPVAGTTDAAGTSTTKDGETVSTKDDETPLTYNIPPGGVSHLPPALRKKS